MHGRLHLVSFVGPSLHCRILLAVNVLVQDSQNQGNTGDAVSWDTATLEQPVPDDSQAVEPYDPDSVPPTQVEDITCSQHVI